MSATSSKVVLTVTKLDVAKHQLRSASIVHFLYPNGHCVEASCIESSIKYTLWHVLDYYNRYYDDNDSISNLMKAIPCELFKNYWFLYILNESERLQYLEPKSLSKLTKQVRHMISHINSLCDDYTISVERLNLLVAVAL